MDNSEVTAHMERYTRVHHFRAGSGNIQVQPRLSTRIPSSFHTHHWESLGPSER